ncbi:MAG: Fic family protein [Lewinella sp.]
MDLPEIIYGTNDKEINYRISRLVKEGRLRRILPRVYTRQIEEDDALVIRRNLWQLIANLFPGSVLSHRSAIEFEPSPKEILYLSARSRRVYKWPGITLKFSKAPKALTDDNPLFKGLYVSSLERASLENLGNYRSIDGESRALDQAMIEERLIQILNSQGEKGLNKFRDRAKEIADGFHWEKEFTRLNEIVSSILSTSPADVLRSPVAAAVAFGRSYDTNRLALFAKLAGQLRLVPVVDRPEKTLDTKAYLNFAFYESFFSNYIEGTTFRVAEAEKIVFEGVILPMRREDSHDVKGTYQICSDREEMSRLATSTDDFIELLRYRHQVIMHSRPQKLPGQFKINANRAGNTFFVLPKDVLGTLEKGFEVLSSISSPLARALYMMFLISEVHPFEDGNGRVARLMMNAELTAGGQTKIIIPTVYRDDYLLNLRRLTRKHDTAAYIRMMDRAHAFSHWLEPGNYPELKAQLEGSNAFEEEDKVLVF